MINIYSSHLHHHGKVAQTVKNLPEMQETWAHPLGWEDPLEKGMAIHSMVLPGEVHGQRSPEGYSSWSCKEQNITEQLTLLLFLLLKKGKFHFIAS